MQYNYKNPAGERQSFTQSDKKYSKTFNTGGCDDSIIAMI